MGLESNLIVSGEIAVPFGDECAESICRFVDGVSMVLEDEHRYGSHTVASLYSTSEGLSFLILQGCMWLRECEIEKSRTMLKYHQAMPISTCSTKSQSSRSDAHLRTGAVSLLHVNASTNRNATDLRTLQLLTSSTIPLPCYIYGS